MKIKNNSNLSQDKLLEAMKRVYSETFVAAPWLEYNGNKDSILDPQIGEWCLWSMIHNGKRNYFTGSLFMSGHLLMLGWDGFRPVYPNDTLYYARVNKMTFPEMSREEFEEKLNDKQNR